MSSVRILITSVGSISAVGLIHCLEPVRRALRVIGTNSVAEAAGNFLTDRTVLVPPTADREAWRLAVARLIAEEKPDLVLNGRDDELGILGEMRSANLWPATRFLVPPAGVDAVFNDKYETARFARAHGLPFTDTAFTAEEVEALLARSGLPLVVKPRAGTGTRSVFLATAVEQVRGALAAGGFVFQEMLPSPLLEDGVAAWAGQAGIPWAWALTSIDHEVDLLLDRTVLSMSMAAGLAEGAFNRDLRLVDEPGMRRAGRAWGEALAAAGHEGPVNLQGRLLADGRYVPFELNARFTGTMIGKARLGRNLVLDALRHWSGLGSVAESPGGASIPLVQRLPVFVALDGAALGALAATGEWTSGATGPDRVGKAGS